MIERLLSWSVLRLKERAYEQQARREAEAAQQRAEAIAEQERLIALQERHEKEKLAAYLRSLGINPNEI